MRLAVTGPAVAELAVAELVVAKLAVIELVKGSIEAQLAEKLTEVIEVVRQVEVVEPIEMRLVAVEPAEVKPVERPAEV